MERPKDVTKYGDKYSERELWAKIANVAIAAGVRVIYCALLLYYVMKSPNVSVADKAKIVGALGYFILPVDIIPDFIPVAGYGDDLAAIIWTINQIRSHITPEIEMRAKRKLSEWFDDVDESELYY